MSTPDAIHAPRDTRRARPTLAVLLALAAFSFVFLVIDQAYFRFISARLPNVGPSARPATLYGVVSRLHLIVPMLLLVVWRPRLFGFQTGRTREHARLLALLLLANCGVVAGYLWLTGSGTPYGGNQWLLTEVVTVPLVEETMWRGVVMAALLYAFRRIYPEAAAGRLAVGASGLAFGLLHAGNLLAGMPAAFVAVQVLNATIWGVVYGYARVKTDSIYPPILLHAAMNLVVVLF